MKFDYLALILTFLIGGLILIFPPFVASVYIPVFIRFPLLFALSLFFLGIVIKRRRFIFSWVPFIVFFIMEITLWIIKGNNLPGEIAYFLLYTILASTIVIGVGRIKGIKFLIRDLYFLLVISFSILAIISFLAYNFDLIPYTLQPVGEDAFYNNFHNPILGYVSIRKFDFGTIGRVCGYFLEPSYLSWFLTTNFFLLDKFIRKSNKLLLSQLIVFLGILATCSTMAWVVFPVILLFKIFYGVLKLMKVKAKTANIIFALSIICGLICFVSFIPKQVLIESLGTSSADDRDDRMSMSFLIIANSSIPDLLLGKGPGFIEKSNGKGESNQFIKLIVENGLISTLLILTFLIYCSYKSKYFMMANLLFLNSVVVLFTPLFILNLLICKWNDNN